MQTEYHLAIDVFLVILKPYAKLIINLYYCYEEDYKYDCIYCSIIIITCFMRKSDSGE